MGPGKVFVLVAMAISLSALVGSSSAFGEKIDFCLHGFGTPALTKEGCVELKGTIHSSGKVSYAAKAVSPVFEGTIQEQCNESHIGGWIEAGSESGSKNNASVTELSFSGGCKPCSTVTVNLLPYEAKFTAGLFPGLETRLDVTLSGCPFGVECVYSGLLLMLDLEIFSGGHASWQLTANETLLREKGSELLCGASTTWKANYSITTPSGAWFPFLL